MEGMEGEAMEGSSSHWVSDCDLLTSLQVGPHLLVLGCEPRANGLAIPLFKRLSKLYLPGYGKFLSPV